MKQLFENYGPMVYRRCFSIVKEDQVAKDLMQDVFVKVFELGLTQTVKSSYLYTMATNSSLNYLRDNKKIETDETLLSQIVSDENNEKKTAQRMWLSKLFATQQVDTQTIAYLHWVDGFNLEEVAKHVGMSVSGVRKRLRILKESKSLLPDVGGF